MTEGKQPEHLRKLVILNLFKEGPTSEDEIFFEGMRVNVVEHRIGWDYATAERLIQRYDGYVDGIALSGVQKRGRIKKVEYMHPGYLALMRVAIKTPLYLADDVRGFFADWTLRRVLKEQPQIFQGRKVLFHCAAISPFLPLIVEAGGEVYGCDALLLAGAPKLIKGESKLAAFLYALRFMNRRGIIGLNPERHIMKNWVQERFAKWVKQHDVIITYNNILCQLESFDSLADKILIVDTLSAQQRARLEKLGMTQIIEFTPEHESLTSLGEKHFSVLTALLDFKKQMDDSSLSFDEYILQWLQQANVRPRKIDASQSVVRKCAFIIHPLSQGDLLKSPIIKKVSENPLLQGFEKLPQPINSVLGRAKDTLAQPVLDALEKAATYVPAFRYGSIRGVVSKKTGQEVQCDVYAYPATPKQLLEMDAEAVYERMIDCAEIAKKRGASLVGLGAYTKVVGDAGATIARRATVPVTNGNSYSASTTIWAAREMLARLGFVSLCKTATNLPKPKAMVVGATGSIGRVTALLIAPMVSEMVLVAPRPDKLLELKDEIQEAHPGLNVRVSTQSSHDLPEMDLVITATSRGKGGTLLDIEKVKSGAVICDCSRPLDVTAEEASKRPDIIVIQSGEVDLPGEVEISADIGLPKPAVYACLAETILLCLEGRYESFSLTKQLSLEKVKEIYKIGLKHGARLSEIQGPLGLITDEMIEKCKALATAEKKQ